MASPTSWILFPQFLCHILPSFPVLFIKTILNGIYMGYVSHNFFQCSVSSEEVNFFRTWEEYILPSFPLSIRWPPHPKQAQNPFPARIRARFTASKIQICFLIAFKIGQIPSSPTAVASPFSLKNAAKAHETPPRTSAVLP